MFSKSSGIYDPECTKHIRRVTYILCVKSAYVLRIEQNGYQSSVIDGSIYLYFDYI